MKSYFKLLTLLGIFILFLSIGFIVFFISVAVKKQNKIDAYYQNSQVYFSGEVIDYEQIRTVEYAIIIRYDSIQFDSKLKNQNEIYLGVVDTANKKIAFIAFVRPPYEFNSHKEISPSKFPDYVSYDGKNKWLKYYKETKIYNTTNEISTLGSYAHSENKFKEFCLKNNIEENMKL